MKNTEIRELSDKDLSLRIKEEKGQVTKIKFSHAVSPIDSPAKIREAKKLVARLLTEQKRRVLANVQ